MVAIKANKQWILLLFESMKVTVHILPSIKPLMVIINLLRIKLLLIYVLASIAVPPHPAQVCQGEYNIHLIKLIQGLRTNLI